jgi:hypothetical protein
LNKKWLLLLVSVIASLVAAYLGWVYLSLLPLLAIAVLNMFNNRSSQLGVDQSVQNQFLTELARLTHECEDNLSHISTTQIQAVAMLSSACKKISLLQSNISLYEASLDNEDSKMAGISIITSEIIQSLQFDDINQQNLAFTKETLGFVRGLLTELALQSNDAFDIKVVELLGCIDERHMQKLNPVASTNLKTGDVNIF